MYAYTMVTHGRERQYLSTIKMRTMSLVGLLGSIGDKKWPEWCWK